MINETVIFNLEFYTHNYKLCYKQKLQICFKRVQHTEYVYCNYSSHKIQIIIQSSFNFSAKSINLTHQISNDTNKESKL